MPIGRSTRSTTGEACHPSESKRLRRLSAKKLKYLKNARRVMLKPRLRQSQSRRRGRSPEAAIASPVPKSTRLAAGAPDALGVTARQPVRPLGARDRPLRVVAQREAGHGEDRRLLLDASRVRQHGPGGRHELDEVEVAQRLDDEQAGIAEQLVE